MKKNIEKKFAKIHARLEPDYRRHCARAGIFDPPPVLWSSFHGSTGSLVMAARILWDGQDPDVSDPFVLCDPNNPENIIGAPAKIAQMAAEKVINFSSSS